MLVQLLRAVVVLLRRVVLVVVVDTRITGRRIELLSARWWRRRAT